MITICLVDDCKTTATILKMLAAKFTTCDGQGVSITHRDGGEELINEIKRGVVYDCIVLDVHMPKMTGPDIFFELVRLDCQSVILYYSAILSQYEARNCMVSKCSKQPLEEIVCAYSKLRMDHLDNICKMAIRTTELQKRLVCQT